MIDFKDVIDIKTKQISYEEVYNTMAEATNQLKSNLEQLDEVRQSVCELIEYNEKKFVEHTKECCKLIDSVSSVLPDLSVVNSSVTLSSVIHQDMFDAQNKIDPLLYCYYCQDGGEILEKICKLMKAEIGIYDTKIQDIKVLKQKLENVKTILKDLQSRYKISSLNQSLSYLHDDREEDSVAKLQEELENQKKEAIKLIETLIVSEESKEYQALIAIRSDKKVIAEYLKENMNKKVF